MKVKTGKRTRERTRDRERKIKIGRKERKKWKRQRKKWKRENRERKEGNERKRVKGEKKERNGLRKRGTTERNKGEERKRDRKGKGERQEERKKGKKIIIRPLSVVVGWCSLSSALSSRGHGKKPTLGQEDGTPALPRAITKLREPGARYLSFSLSLSQVGADIIKADR